jgi:hypothetical protein
VTSSVVNLDKKEESLVTNNVSITNYSKSKNLAPFLATASIPINITEPDL